MGTSPSVTARIRQLLELGTPLEQPGRDFATWHGGERASDGTFSLAFPEYHTDVDAFFEAAQGDWWLDRGYDSARCASLIADNTYIATASLAEVKSLLTFCVRGERFCDGHREAMLKSGRIAAILQRLRALE